MTDDELQGAIDNAALQLSTARTRPARRRAWQRMQQLIAERSKRPHVVAAMERARGLAPEQ